jgi:RNA polymerase sigma-70 factor (ECF subfamily)
MSSPSPEITRMLLDWNQGEDSALQKLVPIVHQELRQQARRYLRNERKGRPFQTTELVNEAYLKLIDYEKVRWQDRAHFFAISAQVMRRILVDMARTRNTQKRGPDAVHISSDQATVVFENRSPDWIALDTALNALSVIDPRKTQVVEMRFFGGLTTEETAEVLGISTSTVELDWKFAKTWLRRELSGSREAPP